MERKWERLGGILMVIGDLLLFFYTRLGIELLIIGGVLVFYPRPKKNKKHEKVQKE